MADRWRRATSSKSSDTSGSKSANDSLAMLTDGLMGSVSDTEEVEEKVKRSASRSGRAIARPKSAAAGQNPAVMDAVSRESAKAFMMKSLQPIDHSAVNEKDVEKMSISTQHGGEEKKKEGGQGAVALLRAVSTRSRPSSRANSPMREEVNNLLEGEKGQGRLDRHDHHHHHHHLPHPHLLRHEHKPKQSKQGLYLAKLLTEAPLPVPIAPTNALLWGRKAITPSQNDNLSDGTSRKAGEVLDVESQQASTGLVRALQQFTSVEVLDGPNSFACKRCWRILNPPTVEEDAKLRLRRLRRGKEEDESERSSDDEASSDEEEKEQKQRNEWNQHRPASNASSSSLRSSKLKRPPTNPHPDWTKTVTQIQTQPVIPSIETTGPQSPSTNENENDDFSIPTSASTPTKAPLLQAPRAIVAGSRGLNLGKAMSSTSSDDGNTSEALTANESSEGSEDERQVDKVKEEGGEEEAKVKTIKFLQEQSAESAKRGLPMARGSTLRKRSTHSLQRRALKRFLISETPKVFVFHFKRFQASSRGFSSYSFSSSFKKIDDYVSFPEYLDVKPWLAPPREEYGRDGHLKLSSDSRALAKAHQEQEEQALGLDKEKRHGRWGWRPKTPGKESQEAHRESDGNTSKTKYRLYAVVVHQGSMSGGHYTAYVLSDRVNIPCKESGPTEVPEMPTPTAVNSNSSSSLDEDKKKPASAHTASTNGTSPPISDNDRNASVSSEGGLRSSISMSSLGSDLGGGGVSDVPSSINNTTSASEAESTNTGSKRAASTASTASVDRSINGGNVNNNPLLRPASRTDQKKDHRRWIYASDTVVRGASIDEVLKAQAYMLFYEQM